MVKTEYLLFNDGVYDCKTGKKGCIVGIYLPKRGSKKEYKNGREAICRLDATLMDQIIRKKVLNQEPIWDIKPEKAIRSREKIFFYDVNGRLEEIILNYDVSQEGYIEKEVNPKKPWNGVLVEILRVKKENGNYVIESLNESKVIPDYNFYELVEKEKNEKKKVKSELESIKFKGKKIGSLDLFLHRYKVNIEGKIENKLYKGTYIIDIAYISDEEGLIPAVIISCIELKLRKGEEKYVEVKGDISGLAKALFYSSIPGQRIGNATSLEKFERELKELIKVPKKGAYGEMCDVLNYLKNNEIRTINEVGGPFKYLKAVIDYGYGLTPF